MASSVHRFHPDPEKGDHPDSRIFGDCEACRENVEEGSLDLPTLRWLVLVCNQGHFPHPPNENERLAESKVWRSLLLVERLAGKDWRELIGLKALR